MASVKSARGELVDFDLLKIRNQMAAAPKPTSVQAREEFVDAKLRRRLKTLTTTVQQTAAQQPAADSTDATPTTNPIPE